MTRRMVDAVQNPRVNVLGHCTGRMVTGGRGNRRAASSTPARSSGLCGERHGGGDQLPAGAPRPPRPGSLLLAREIGCLFTIDSDAHAPGQLDFLGYGAERAEAAGVPDRIVTTWPKSRLLKWANG